MATPFSVSLVTPERILFAGEAEEVSLRSDGGEITFLARHEDYIGAVDVTVVHIGAPSGEHAEAEELRAAVHGGFAHVDRDGVRILAAVAELGSEIDVERARRALAAAEAAPEEPEETEEEVGRSPAMRALLEPSSPEVAARRARARLEAAGASAG